MLKRERQLYLVQPVNLHNATMQLNSLRIELQVSAATITQYLPELPEKIIFNQYYLYFF